MNKFIACFLYFISLLGLTANFGSLASGEILEFLERSIVYLLFAASGFVLWPIGKQSKVGGVFRFGLGMVLVFLGVASGMSAASNNDLPVLLGSILFILLGVAVSGGGFFRETKSNAQTGDLTPNDDPA